MTTVLLVALGGSAGAVTRFVVDGVVRARSRSVLPVATILVNVTGSLLLGLLTGLTLYHGAPAALSTTLGTGFCGGYTTFSAAAVETVRLARAGRWAAALVSGAGTVVLTVAAAALGVVIGCRV